MTATALSLFIGLLFAVPANRPEWVDVYSAEPAKLAGTRMTVTVEFVVQSTHRILPDGPEVRLASTGCALRTQGSFVIFFPASGAREKLGGEDIVSYFKGKRIRVTGKLEHFALAGDFAIRPGIRVSDVREIRLVGRKELKARCAILRLHRHAPRIQAALPTRVHGFGNRPPRASVSLRQAERQSRRTWRSDICSSSATWGCVQPW